jgi:uncharacterized protein YajQ (UPF0234 family)
MAQSFSFDIVSKVDLQEVANAVNNASRELVHRYDFRGSVSKVTFDCDCIALLSDDEMKMKQLIELVKEKLVDRKVPLRALIYGKLEDASHNTVRQVVSLQSGIPIEKAREIVKMIKISKLKVQATIQAEQVRVQGRSKDDLQAAISLIREKDLGIDMQFVNFR